MRIDEIKTQHDIVAVMQSAGLDLKRQSKRYVGRCPFHNDTHPSFVVFGDRYYCFGCHERGDVIDFVMRRYGLSFRDALRHLGVEACHAVPPEHERKKAKRKLIQRFRRWEIDYGDELSLLIRTGYHVLQGLPFENDLRAWLCHELPVWQYHHGIIATGDDRKKFQLWRTFHERHGKCQRI